MFQLAQLNPGDTLQRVIIDFRASADWPAAGANSVDRPYAAWHTMLAIQWVGEGDGFPVPGGYYSGAGDADYVWTQHIQFRTDMSYLLPLAGEPPTQVSVYSNSQPSENIDSHSMRKSPADSAGQLYLVVDGQEFDLYNGEGFYFDFSYAAAVLVLAA